MIDVPYSLQDVDDRPGLGSFPLVYQGEGELAFDGRGRVIHHLGKAAIVDLESLAREDVVRVMGSAGSSVSTLRLSSTQVGDAVVREVIERLPGDGLYLSLWGGDLSAQGVVSIGALGGKVVALDLDLGARGELPPELRASLNRLGHLRLSGTARTHRGMVGLGPIRTLRALSIERWQPSQESSRDDDARSLEPLLRLRALRHLGAFGPIVDLTCALPKVLPRIIQLDVGAKSVCEEGLAAAHRELRHLRLHVPGIPEPGLRHLSGLRSLETLTLRDAVRLGPSSFRALSRFGSLRMLHLANGEDWTSETIRPLARLRHLEMLVLRGYRLDDGGLNVLSELASLRGLEIGLVSASATGWRRMLLFKQLEHLVADGGRMQPPHYKTLTEMPALRSLEIRWAKTRDEDLLALRQAVRLESLILSFASYAPRLSDSGLESLAHLRALRALKLGSAGQYLPKVTDAGAMHLSRLRHLEALWLPRSRIGDEGLRHIATLPRLRSLTVDSDRITAAGLWHLVHLRRLHRLEIGLARLSAASVEPLARLGNLRVLVLRRTSIPQAALDTLRRRLPQCRVESR